MPLPKPKFDYYLARRGFYQMVGTNERSPVYCTECRTFALHTTFYADVIAWELYIHHTHSGSFLQQGKVKKKRDLAKLHQELVVPKFACQARPDTRRYLPRFPITPLLVHILCLLEGVGFKWNEELIDHLALTAYAADGSREAKIEILSHGGIINVSYYSPGSNRQGNPSMRRRSAYKLADNAALSEAEPLLEWLRQQDYPLLVRRHRFKILSALAHVAADSMPA